MTGNDEPFDRSDDPTLDFGSVNHQSSQDRSLPSAIGPFRIVRILGEGGMGVVYEAEQDQPRRSVALKVIRAGAFANEAQVRSFEREGDMLARLKHPGIGGIHQVGETDDGHPYLVMELIQGRPLDDYLAGLPPLSGRADLELRLHLFRQICDAVHYAHQKGIIHRDLKPSNILVVEPGESATTSGISTTSSGSSMTGMPRTKILDFGLARLTDHEATQITEVGMIKGTLQYMSPEQTRARSDEVDTRADVYALGALLYETLSGRRPYDLAREAFAEAIRIICENTPTPLGSTWSGAYRPDPDIETIVGKALEKEPERRYSSVAALSEDIGRYMASQPILARPPSAVYQLRKMFARNRAVFALGAVLLVLVVASSIVSTALFFRAQRAAARERIEAEKAQEVATFMTSMLDAVGPAVARGRDTTMLREILDETVERIDAELPKSPEVAAVLQSQIGTTYFNLSELKEAEKLYREALEKRDATGPPDDPDRLTDLNSLAIVLSLTDRFDEAEALFRGVLEARREVLPEDSPETASTMIQLGNLLNTRSRLEESEQMLAGGIELLRRGKPINGEHLGVALNSLGNLYHGQGRLDEAEALYSEALEVHLEAIGEDHPFTLADRHNLAYLMRSRGDFVAAEAAFLEILEQQTRILGPDHRDIATTLNSLGSVRQAIGDFAGARERYRQSLDLSERIFGKRSEQYAHALNSYAVAIKLLGDNVEAERMYRETLSIRLEVLGPDNEDVANSRENLGAALISLERHDEAETELQQALRIYRGLYGEDHRNTLGVLNEIGRVQRATDRLEEAEQTLSTVLDARRRTLGDSDGYVARSEYEMGMLLIDLGDAESVARGEALLEQAAETYIRAHGEDYPGVPLTRFRLGRQLAKRGAYAEAEGFMIQAYDGLIRAYGEDHRNVSKAAEEIAELYVSWGKPDKAAEWQAR